MQKTQLTVHSKTSIASFNLTQFTYYLRFFLFLLILNISCVGDTPKNPADPSNPFFLLTQLLICSSEGCSGETTEPTITYSDSPFSFVQNTAIASVAPILTGAALSNCTVVPPLPVGLLIDSSSCGISGMPTVIQVATDYTITAINGFGSGTANINIEVTIGTAPTISYTGSPFSFPQNTTITTLTPTLGGSATTGCSAVPALPTGLTINATSCAITGTPTTIQGATNHTITASNGFGNGNTVINIEVTATGTAPTISYTGSPFIFTQNSAITTLTPTLSGSVPTGCSAVPALPTGLIINATSCAITGTPTTTQGATNHTITVTNGFGSDNTIINITVGAPPTISYTGSPFNFALNTAITTITATLGGSTPTNCTTTPVLPTGLSINTTTCAITGTPTVAQSITAYTITASNSFGSNVTNFSITIGSEASFTHTDEFSNVNQTSYTFTGVNFGTASVNRLIVIPLRGIRDVGGTVSSATIGGVAATIHQNQSIGNGSIAMISAIVPTGTSGNVVVNWSVLQAGMSIDVYRLNNLQSTVPIVNVVDTTAPLSQNITYAANTVVIAFARSRSSTSFTWSGSANLVEQNDRLFAAPFAIEGYSSAMRLQTSAGTSVGVTATPTNTTSPGMLIIGFR